jgi:hypothetical protein
VFRPNRLFTADQHIVLYPVGHLKQSKTGAVSSGIVETLGQ